MGKSNVLQLVPDEARCADQASLVRWLLEEIAELAAAPRRVVVVVLRDERDARDPHLQSISVRTTEGPQSEVVGMLHQAAYEVQREAEREVQG